MSNDPYGGKATRHGFTLIELLLVCIITAVLVSIGYSSFEQARRRAESVTCIANLRSLHVAFDNYLQENNQVWPHPPASSSLDIEAKWWVDLLTPYGPTQDTWRCPSRKRAEGTAPVPPGMLPETIDYLPALFDSKPGTAHKWSTQPWLIEVGDFHGGGNLVLQSTGEVVTSKSGMLSGS